MSKLLIAEDDEGIAFLLGKRLKREKIDCFIVYDAKSVLEYLEKEEAHLILLDFILPDMTAEELIPEIESRYGKIPFIVMTGQGNERVAVNLMKAGALDYVTKDDNFWEFVIPSLKRAIVQIETESRLRLTERAFLESEAKLRQIIDLVPDMIYAVDAKRNVVMANQAVCLAYGKPMAELVGKSIDEVNKYSNAFIQFSPQEIKELQRNKQMIQGESQFLINEQEEYFQTTKMPFQVSDSKKEHYLGISVRISELKLAEKAILEANIDLENRVIKRTEELQNERNKLMQSNRLKDDILGIVAHDLRSPLTIIFSMTDLIEMEAPEFFKEKALYFNNIVKSSNRMNTLISDLLDSSKLESDGYSLKLKKENVIPLIEDTYQEFQQQLKEKEIDLIIEKSSDTIVLNMNKSRFWQIIKNLLSNAIKFSNEKAKVKLKVDAESEDDTVIITIQDYGIGMSQDRLDILFEKFTKAGRKGTRGEYSTGLGMSICKRLVELHHGEINVESKIDQGTLIRIRFAKA